MSAGGPGRIEAGLDGFDAMVSRELRDPYPDFARSKGALSCRAPGADDRGGTPRLCGLSPRRRDTGAAGRLDVLVGRHRSGNGRGVGPKSLSAWTRRNTPATVPWFRKRSGRARWHGGEQSLVQRVLDDLIDGFADRGQANLVSEYTFPFPAKVIAGILGLPEADYQQFQQWAVGIIGITHDWERALRCRASCGTTSR